MEILNYLKKLVYKVLAENCPKLSTTVLGQIQGEYKEYGTKPGVQNPEFGL